MYRTVSLLVYSYGMAAFVALFALWCRQLRLGRSELRGWQYPAVFLCSAAWFALNLITLEYFILLAAACAFPPLLGRLFHARGLPLLTLGSAGVAALSLLHHFETLPVTYARRDLSAAFCVLIAWPCVSVARRRPREKQVVFLLGSAVIVVSVALYTYGDWMSLVMRSMPLTLLAADSYLRRRFLFLDLFAKWAANIAIALAALTFWFRFVPTSLQPVQSAVLFLPLIWGVPALCLALGGWLDRHVLGRRFSPDGARALFLHRLQSLDTEAALLAEAPVVLEEIFHTRAAVSDSGAVVLDQESAPRPLFSEDLALARSLSQTLGILLDNRRLEARRRDSLLAAGRSELKALRAQIDPHFLFNALNTVACLIPGDPARAERTVEKLAEVFRYTLQRSDSELAPLSEELEFIGAWLDVQRARFGERLTVETNAAPETLAVRVPALVLQTLVENAVKHGVARSAGPCRVGIRAEVDGPVLRLTVTDTGPGPLALENTQGHGLKNARARLAGYYGELGRLTLSRDGSRAETAACIEIPL